MKALVYMIFPAVILLLCSAVSFLSTTEIVTEKDAVSPVVTPMPVPALVMRAEPEGDL